MNKATTAYFANYHSPDIPASAPTVAVILFASGCTTGLACFTVVQLWMNRRQHKFEKFIAIT